MEPTHVDVDYTALQDQLKQCGESSSAKQKAAEAIAAVAPKKKPASSRKRKQTPRKTTDTNNLNFIERPVTDDDVLLGRGGRTNHHPGNAKYLELKLEIQSRYLAALKEDTTQISQVLVDAVHNLPGNGGRFLKLRASTNEWYEVDSRTARKKASQTLREINTPEQRAAKRAKYNNSNSRR